MHTWNEEVFKLLGNCMGRAMEVDQRTTNKEFLASSLMKVMMNRFFSFLVIVTLWVEAFKYQIEIEEDNLSSLKDVCEG